MPSQYNILHIIINGDTKEKVDINRRNPKEMAEGFKTVYRLETGVGDWKAFYFMESSMNKLTTLKK